MSAVTAGGGYRPVVYLPSARVSAAPVPPLTQFRQPRSHLRLTRRGWLVLTVLAAIPLVIAAFLFAVNSGGASAGTAATVSTASFHYVTVEAGESLWQVAQSVAPNADPRDVVDDILSFNALDSSQVFPGQQLAIPNKYSN